ncbi:MAG: hypothetical protein WCX12_02035 [Candidatus Paceibacterota bacterium]|jgi:hypothetical protein
MNLKDIKLKNFFQSKIFLRFMIGLAVLVVLLVVFQAGEMMGFKRASFSYQWGENYFRGVAGPRGGFPDDFRNGGYLRGNGIFGSIISVASSTLIIQDQNNIEKNILVSKETVIRRFRDSITASDLKPNEKVTVIGSPNSSGQIEAKLIRVVSDLPPILPNGEMMKN